MIRTIWLISSEKEKNEASVTPTSQLNNGFSKDGVLAIVEFPRQNGRHFTDDILKSICLNGNIWITIKISLKFVSKGPINNIPALVQIMTWRRPADKPISEPMMHQWFKLSTLSIFCLPAPGYMLRPTSNKYMVSGWWVFAFLEW